MPPKLHKYPRTRHIESSRLAPGDEDNDSVPFAELAGKHLVVEEKLDGANSGISFDRDGKLWLQSRGHHLTGGAREKQFAPLKAWANTHAQEIAERIADRFILFGEWLYARHTIFYDALPHHFLEFDLLELESGTFLSTERRRQILGGSVIRSAPVLFSGRAKTLSELLSLVRTSLYKTARWRERLAEVARERNVNITRVWNETDPSDLMEGLYIKHEEDGHVVARYKWVRASFLAVVVDSESHWLSRPIIPNGVVE